MLKRLEAETKAAVDRIAAAKEGFAEALVALGREDVLTKVAEAIRIETFLSDEPMEAALGRLVGGLPIFQSMLEKFSMTGKDKLGGRLQGQNANGS